jgi:glycosyltransferase involved in cell wall biosynthesis
MKVLYLTKYSRNGASSRLRSYQYFPLLEKEGMTVTVKPFFDEDYLNTLYAKKKISKCKLATYYLGRFFVLFSINKYDKVVIEKELFPYFFSWFEKLLSLLNIPYFVDYDDAIFHNYDLSPNKLIQFFLKNKIDNVMRYSGCVLAGNDYLFQKAKHAGARSIITFPTVIDVVKYESKPQKKSNEKVIIGWIGSPSTFKYVKNLSVVFKTLIEEIPFEIHIIGANEVLDFQGSIHYLKWSESTEVAMIANLDIGIMPLEHTPWELGKCAYKLIQYMGCGLPVVASSVGMNNEVVDDGVNGFLVENNQEWIDKLTILLKDAHLRKQFGTLGREKVEKEYSLQNNIQKLIPLLKDANRK